MLDRARKITRLCVAAVFVIVGIGILSGVFLSEGALASIIVAACFSLPFFILAYGLLRRLRWALRISAFIFLLIAVFSVGGAFSPFIVGDYLAAGIEPPSVEQTLFWYIPFEMLLLAVVYLLDPIKPIKEKKQAKAEF